ncbi:hypothetical protein GCM10010129_24490 [Streptomyces fumigatiscleroticus]|nr:hypothetical protein GCM10010129_24490 [Streptomyces fumigatiscleroticus]
MAVMQPELALGGDREQAVVAMVVARAWRDDAFRAAFVADPRAVLADEGLEYPETTRVVVLEDTDRAKYVCLPDDAGPGDLADHLHTSVPVPDGCELRVVQNTPDTRYVVIPVVPDGVEVGRMTESELISSVPSPTNGIYVYTIEAATVGSSVNILAEAVAVIVLT